MFENFSKSVGKFQVLLNLTRIMGTLNEDLCTFIIISPWMFFGMRNISHKIVEKIKTRILCSKFVFLKSYRL
jgi:hypothetical protein